LYLVSFISLNLILSPSFTLVNLLEFANGYAGGVIPAEVFTFAEDPMLSAFAIAIVDLVLRIIGFIILFPLIKGILSLLIFRPIWSFGIKKALLKKQNEKLEMEFQSEGKKQFKPSKKLHKTLGGRFIGGAFGAAQGFLVAFILLLPLLVISGFLTVVTDPLGVEQEDNYTELAVVGGVDLGPMQEMLDDYLAQIDEMNAQGLSAYLREITVEGVPLDRYIFDQLFTTDVVEDDQVTEINWIKELEGIIKISRTVYDGGYLSGDFGLDDINEERLGDVEVIFDYFKNSDLIAYMIPAATRYGVDNLTDFEGQLPVAIPQDIAEQLATTITDIDWNQEFGNIQAIVDAILVFGSVEELQAYMADPMLVLELSPEDGEKLADVVRAIGNMQLWSLVPAAVDYATTLDDVKNQLTWIDETEREAYLQEQLAFLIENDEFFSGETGEFARLALLVEAVFTDEFGDVDLASLMDTANPEALLDPDNVDWIDNLFEKIVDLDLLTETIPLGVDYAFYTQVGDLVDEEMAGELEVALDTINWQDELLNIGDIYKEVVQIGAGQLLGESPDYYQFIDNTVTSNLDGVRLIVEKIFEDSVLVNSMLTIAAPVLVERYVTDQDLEGILQEALISDPVSGDIDFSVGQEINTLLDIVESIYQFTNTTELMNISGMTADEQLGVFANFGSLNAVEFEQFQSAFGELQILDRTGSALLEYAKNTMAIDQVYVPEDEVNLGDELGSILGFVYEAAKYTYDVQDLYPTFEEIDFAPLFADDDFRSYILATPADNHSALLFQTIAHNIKLYSQDVSISEYLAVPQILMDASVESAVWESELNALLGAVFDVVASFEGSDILTMSARDVILFTQTPTDVSIELVTQFADPIKADETFGSLDSSIILRSSLKTAIDSLGAGVADSLGGHEIKTPAIALDGDMLELGILVELINGLSILVEDLNTTWNYTTVAELTDSLNADGILPAYNNLEDGSLISFGSITLIKGVLSELLLSDNFQAFGIETINGAQDLFVAPADFLALDDLLLDAEGVKGEEIGKLLISIKSLQVANTEELSAFGPEVLNNMIDRNVDGGKDDLDRFFDSGILYTFLDKIFQLDAINDFANDALSGAFGDANITIDLAPHPALLGNEIDDEPIEVGRIPKDEFRHMIVSLNLLGDFNAIGIETFPNLVDPYSETDDFTTFLESDYIYTIVGRLFENEGFGDYIGDLLGSSFGDGLVLDMTAPEDAKGLTGVEEDIITKVELRRIMVSFKLLGLDQGTDNIGIPQILGMSGRNDVLGVDDFDRFIASKYIADKLSIILLSDAIIDTIGTGRFTAVDFILPPSSYTTVGGRERLTDAEFANIFNGLSTLGLEDLEGSGFTPDQITGLGEAEISAVLDSNYLYTVIDLMLKSETSFTIPSGALEVAGEYTGMVKKSEVLDIFKAIEIFGITGGTAPDPATISVGDIQELLAETDSAIVQSLLSEAIIQALGAENIPADAYEEAELLTQEEIEAIVDALAVISGDPDAPITSIDVQNVTVGQINDLDLAETGSATIKQLISDAILDAINPSNIPEEAYEDTGLSSQNNNVLLGFTTLDAPVLRRLSDEELQEIIGALNILVDNNMDALVTEISTDVKVGQAVQLKTNNSLIIKQLVSDNVETALAGFVVIPDVAYIDVEKTRLSNTEINNMIDAMVILANNDLNASVTTISTDVTVGQTQDLKTNESYIIRQLITDNIVDILGAASIPDDAYDDVNVTMLSQSEISNMIDAMYILANENDALLVTAISTDVTVGQTQDLKTIDSLIIRQLITDNIVDVLSTSTTIPANSYDPLQPTMLTQSEINDMIDALVVLADGDTNTPVASIDTNVTVGQVQGLGSNTSLIIRQLITDNIVDVLGLTVAIHPDTYDPLEPTMFTTVEIGEMIDALVILANNDLNTPVATISTDVNVGQVQGLKTNDSLIIRQLMTDNIEDVLATTVDFPAEVYDTTYTTMLTTTEIGEMIDALYILSDENPNLPVASISTDVTVGQTQDLKVNSSLIIRQLISDSIVDNIGATASIPLDAHIDSDVNKRLTDTEINLMIDALLILADNDGDVLVSAISTDVTIGQLKGLNANDSLIIGRLITDTIVDTIDPLDEGKIPLNAYVDGNSANLLTETEVADMIAALEILAGSTVPGDRDDTLVSAVSTDVTVGQTQDLKTNGSLIIKQLISDSIVDTIGATANIPLDAHIDGDANNRLTDTEINNMIDALLVLADGNEAVLVSAISTDVTIGQLKGLNANDSLIINRLITDSIVDTIDPLDEGKIPLEAYVDGNSANFLTETEVSDMIAALEILAGSTVPGDRDTTLVSAISTDVTVGQTQDLKTNGSVIIKQLISDSIVDSIGLTATIPDAAHIDSDTNKRLTDTEINHMIDALLILADGNEALLVSAISTDITLGQLNGITENESLIMQKLISDSIIDSVGVAKVPDDAYLLDTPGNNLKTTEVDAMIDALYILAYDPLNPGQDLDDVKVSAVNINVTVGQTQDLKTNGSVIIKQVISDSIVDMLTAPKIRQTAYINSDPNLRLTNDEIGYMIDAIYILADGDEDVLVTSITVNESTLAIDTLQQFNENSIILNRLISNAVITSLGSADIPDESFEDDVARTDLVRPEIDAILTALDTLGIGTGGAGTITTASLTFDEIDSVIAIGTTDLIKYPLGFSPIVVHILSTPMISAVSDIRSGHDYGVPTTAYRNTNDLRHDEIEGLIDALKLIGNVAPEDEDTTTIADVTIDPDSFNGTMINNLVALDKLIVYRLISKGINDSTIDTDASHVTDINARNYDPGLPVTPLVYDIKIAEMSHIATSMDILGVSSIASVATDITIAGLQALTAGQIETLVEANTDGPNTIIYYIIAETVDSSNTLFDTLSLFDPITYPDPDIYYVYDGPTRVRLKRTSIATALSEL
jgi:hypothetical protein